MTGIPRILKRLPADVLRLKRRSTAPGRPPKGHVDLYVDDTGALAGVGDTGAAISVGGVDAHLADTTAAHAATAIAFTPAGSIAATTVQAAIEEVAAEAGGGGSVATDAIFDAKGDLPVGTGANTAEKLPVNGEGMVLIAAAAEATGLKWTDSPDLYDLDVYGPLAESGALSPAQLTASVDDYSPTGISAASALLLDQDAPWSVTGIDADTNTPGRVLRVFNVSAFALTLPTEDAGSTAANQFLFDDDLVLESEQGCRLWYDDAANRWRLEGAGKAASAGGGSVATDTIWDAAGDIVQGTGSNTAARLAIGTAGQALRVNSGATALEYAKVGLYNAYVNIRDEKAANTDGGTFTSGAWRTRDLNTEHADTAGIASVASNQITLAAGTYRCHIVVPGAKVDRHKARLQDITNTATLLHGTTAFSWNTSDLAITHSVIAGRFTLAGSTVLEVQHQCQTTYATGGYGHASNFAVAEIYTVAEFWRES
jgi:hypothetical protein